jgi:LPS export ABC transporter protein LptC
LNRNSLFLFSLVSVAAGISWWLSDITAPEQVAARGKEQFPDAYARELTVISYTKQGQPQYKLKTPLMRHYEKDDTTKLDRQLMWQFNGEKPPWTVRAEQAIMTSDKDTLFMAGEVYIDRDGTDAISPYHITTRDLTVNTVTAYAETAQPIRFASDDHQIDGIGMRGWLQDPVRIKLLDKVRGTYELQ